MTRNQLYLGDLIAFICILAFTVLLVLGGTAFGFNHYVKSHPQEFKQN